MEAAAKSAYGDASATAVGQRLDVSAQTMTNWATRGVSKEGAFTIEAVYGCPASYVLGDVIAHTFAPSASRSLLGAKAALPSQSQPLRLDPEMITETHRALREFCAEDHNREFWIEDAGDAALFVLAYEMRAAMPARPTKNDWTQFGRKITRLDVEGRAGRGRSDDLPAQGSDEGKVARGGKRKKG